MAKVILEIIQRGIHQYHKIDSFPVTIGRAFDNDVILPDVTISAHHLIIQNEDDKFFLHNLADENGTKYLGNELGNTPIEVSLPSSFKISGLKARLLPIDMPVEATHVRDCSGLFCLFSNPIWALLLIASTIALYFYGSFVTTTATEDVFFYLEAVLPPVWIMLGIIVIVSGISRLFIHRWEIIATISIVSLMFLLPLLFEHLGRFFAYMFTHDSLQIWFKYIAKFIVIPSLVAVFIVKIMRARWLPSAGIAMLLYSPFLVYHMTSLVRELSIQSGFSPVPFYSKILSPRDYRLNSTISLEQFSKEAHRATADEVKKMLIEAKKKDEESS